MKRHGQERGVLQDFLGEQMNQCGYGTSGEDVHVPTRRDQDRLRLRGVLLAGAKSPQANPVNEGYFDSLRRKAKVG